MGDDPKEETGTGSQGKEEGSSSSLYEHHPCYYVRLLMSAFLRCLGFDPQSPDPPNGERGKKAPNDDPPAITPAARRPTRPPVNPGKGGQTN